MNNYRVYAHLFANNSEDKHIDLDHVFTAADDIEAITSGVGWVQRHVKDTHYVYELSVATQYPSEASGDDITEFEAEEFFLWSWHHLLPLEVFTAAVVTAARGLKAPSQ